MTAAVTATVTAAVTATVTTNAGGTMATFQYSFPTRIHFGSGAITLLPTALKELGAARPLIVTDRGLAPLAPVTGSPGSRGATVTLEPLAR